MSKKQNEGIPEQIARLERAIFILLKGAVNDNSNAIRVEAQGIVAQDDWGTVTVNPDSGAATLGD